MVGKTIFITGASSGIGEAIAKECAARGYRLALVARRESELDRVKREILADHPDTAVETAVLDVTEYDRVPVVFDNLTERLGEIDIAFVNAGVSWSGMIGDGNFDQFRRIVETNLIGAMATIDTAVAYFKTRGSGHVVAVSSVAGWRGLPNSSAYSASKMALNSFMQSAQSELAFDRGFKFTLIAPGFINTPMVERLKSRPFELTPERGAKKMMNAVERGARYACVPWLPWQLLKPFLLFAPNWVINYLARWR
jgi:short-subunit dehydrogenase